MRARWALPFVLLLAAPAAGAHEGGGRVVALVTAETQNQLIAFDLASHRVIHRFHLAADPENVDGRPGVRMAVVVSTRGHAVTLIDTESLRIVRVLRRFTAPHIAAITPGGRYAYVTDDGSGELNVIDLRRRRLVRRVFVGLGAHHLSVSPDRTRTWVALGERAHRIVMLNSTRLARPRVLASFAPDGEAHDLAFTPSSARVWVTRDDSPRVAVFDAGTHRLMRTFSGGRPPQHVAFVPRRRFVPAAGFVTSGYGRTIQLRNARRRFLYGSFRIDYGSFNLGLGGGYLATASLYRGTLTLFSGNISPLGHWHLAPATRDVALVVR